MIENRKNERYAGNARAFAALIRPNEPITIGQIIDISADGVSVRYISKKANNIGFSYIKLFISNGQFAHTKRIQCNIIYDMSIDENSWYDLLVRRCGAQFEQLPSEKRRELESFIQQFIVDAT